MKLLKQLIEQTNNGAADKPIKGLYDAKPGDILKIGVEGRPDHKMYTKIMKKVSNGRLQDDQGNIFGHDGHIFRRKSWQLKGTNKQIVFAQHVTQKELDDNHDKQRREYLNGVDWKSHSDEMVEKVLKMLNVSMGTVQKNIRYSDDK